MKTSKLLLIGDIHFPEVKSALQGADYKDKAYPQTLAELTIPNRLSNVAREVAHLHDADKSIAGLLLCGDLTSRGELDGYKECVAYLNKVLQVSTDGVWSNNQVHVVPGNHDVDRKLCDPNNSIFDKFIPLTKAWQGPQARSLTVQAVRETSVGEVDFGYAIFSLNSCVGCGEKRYLPEQVREELGALLKKELDADTAKGFALVGEQLDTPAFVADDMTTLVERIQDIDSRRLAIVLAHHNILPQAEPRIDLYTDAINSGLVRSRLLHCPHPVVYCHGHLHTDTIEVITTPGSDAPLISIAVPRFTDGFDVLETHFGNRGLPLGCTIHRHRVQNDGGIIKVELKARRIPVCTREYEKYADEQLTLILRHIPYGKYLRIQDIVQPIRSDRGKAIRSKAIASYLLEAEWLGILSIQNRIDEPRLWHFRRNVP